MEEITNPIREQLEQNLGTVVPPVAPVVQQSQSLEERNWTMMRKKIEEEERARIKAEARARELEEQHARFAQQQKPIEQEEEEDDSLTDPDGYVYQKTLQKKNREWKQEINSTKQEVQQLKQALSELRAEKQISERTDFKEVCSDENIAVFARLYPREYNALFANQNLDDRAVMAYNMIKNYGVVPVKQEMKKAEVLAAVDKKIQQNAEKPMTGWATPSQSPVGKFGKYDADGRLRLSDAARDQIVSDMRKKRGIY